jgi:HEAT repeat protein
MMRCAWVLGAALAVVPLGCVADDLSEVSRVFSAPTPMEAAKDALNMYNADKRREGVVLLANSTFGGAAPYMEMYRTYVETDTDPLVRAAALTALGRHGTPEDALLIAPVLSFDETSHQHVRWCAALALQRLHNAEVVPELVRCTLNKEEVGEVREAACTALGQYKEDRVVQALLASLDARELAVNAAASQSLHMLTGQDWGLDVHAWGEWYRVALAKDTAFAGSEPYLYPTYRRGMVWWEHVAFWLDQQWEVPQSPAGLKPAGARRTWDADKDAAG